jgi:uncharacterized membrane protein
MVGFIIIVIGFVVLMLGYANTKYNGNGYAITPGEGGDSGDAPYYPAPGNQTQPENPLGEQGETPMGFIDIGGVQIDYLVLLAIVMIVIGILIAALG